jgi:hypothetical protein
MIAYTVTENVVTLAVGTPFDSAHDKAEILLDCMTLSDVLGCEVELRSNAGELLETIGAIVSSC